MIDKPPRAYAGEIYWVLDARDRETDKVEREKLQAKAQEMMDHVPHGIKTVVREYVADWRIRARNRLKHLRRR
jgi:hypothetical protein